MNKKIVSLIVLVGFSIFVVAYGLFTYNNAIKKELDASIHSTLLEIISQQKYTFLTALKGEATILETYAASMVQAKLTPQQLITSLNRLQSKTGFEKLVIANAKGMGLNSFGTDVNIANEPTFQAALRGGTAVSQSLEGNELNKMISCATPLIADNQVKGVLYASYGAYKLNSLFLHSFGGKGYAYILNQQGTVIARTDSKNPIVVGSNQFGIFGSSTFKDYDSFTQIQENMRRQLGGHAKYRYQGYWVNAHYEPLGMNNWYIFSAVPTSVVAVQEDQIMGYNKLFATAVLAIFICFLLFFYLTSQRHLKIVEKIAFVDTLTGQRTQRKFDIDGLELLKTPHQYCFLLLDVDKFKVLNDALGFENGDRLLNLIAQVLEKALTPGEIFGRCNSDKFHILLLHQDEPTTQARAEVIIKQMEALFRQKINAYYNLVLSLGIYVIADPRESLNIISDKARHAHRLIKGQESSSICFYDETIRKQMLHDKIIENKMHAALEREEFQLYLQPKYLLKTHQICGAEALVRWIDQEGEMLYPNEFIPLFEQNGFITSLDFYMLKKTCQVMRTWLDANLQIIPISVNFSRFHLKNKNFVEDIAKVIQEFSIPANYIEIELTESTMFNNEDLLNNVLNELHHHGFTLSMDDFGSGYSSLGLLKNLPVDAIKLDRTFFSQYRDLQRAKIVISNVITMAKELEISTVAEGVETLEHIEMLANLGCDIVQGYYYAMPMPHQSLFALLQANQKKQ